MVWWHGRTAYRRWYLGVHKQKRNVVSSVMVVDGFENDSLRYPCWNPVLFKPSKGPLMLFYKVGPNPNEWWGMLMTSDDEGKSWSEPRRLGKNSAIGDLLGPVKNKPIELADGTIICPSSSEVEV